MSKTLRKNARHFTLLHRAMWSPITRLFQVLKNLSNFEKGDFSLLYFKVEVLQWKHQTASYLSAETLDVTKFMTKFASNLHSLFVDHESWLSLFHCIAFQIWIVSEYFKIPWRHWAGGKVVDDQIDSSTKLRSLIDECRKNKIALWIKVVKWDVNWFSLIYLKSFENCWAVFDWQCFLLELLVQRMNAKNDININYQVDKIKNN